MKLHLIKMQGCGNDFLLLDAVQSGPPEFKQREIRHLCDRHFGVGADGLVVLKKSANADLGWNFYNADGSVAEMCGNAARCVIRYANDKYLAGETISVDTAVGVIKGRVTGKNEVEVSLLPQRDFSFTYQERVLDLGDQALQVYSTNTGVPHAVVEVSSLDGYPVSAVGRKIQAHAIFQPAGTNVTFFERSVSKKIKATTFERGVYAETLACGTGAAAAALMFCELYMETPPVTVEVPGGELQVDFSPVSHVLLLRGAAEYTFEIELDLTDPDFEKKVPYEQRPKK